MAHCRPLSSLWTAAIIAATALVVALPALAATGEAPTIGKPGCNTRCGDVNVPYPFGFGPASCSVPGFNLTCDNTTRPGRPRLLLGDDGILEVKEILMKEASMRVVSPPIFSDARNISSSGWCGDRGLRGQYSIASDSELVVTGCNVQATLHTNTYGGDGLAVGCSPHCDDRRVLSAGDVRSYDGGFCSIPVNTIETSYSVELIRGLGNGTKGANDDLPVYVLIAEEGWFKPDRAVDLMNLEKPPGARHGRPKADLPVPVIFDWACLNDGSCNASVDTTRAHCRTGSGGELLWCECNEGYEGNPYLTAGCQDIDECKNRKHYGCFGDCHNTHGGFNCSCPWGSIGNASIPNGCIKSLKNTGIRAAIIGVACGTGLVLSVLISFFAYKKFKHRRAQILKHKFFEQNRGQLLRQLVSQKGGSGERMIITLEEIEKATHNFDKDLVVGGGGHGTVYKGILSNQHIVAIKKPKKMIQKEIDEFINEVAILSQINHRNIVKLYGCCLETEVPMLVYEFISNGTLYEHLHVEGPRSLPWNDRLRIAIETAKSLSYLHYSTASMPIIHRDVKSANILLDDNLTAKVADFGASTYILMDKSGLTTRAQGTRGYWDPAYFYTGRLTEKSDVYSFGVVLVELVTTHEEETILILVLG
ncbi:unnamed protein product [Alopecurus aequalis]